MNRAAPPASRICRHIQWGKIDVSLHLRWSIKLLLALRWSIKLLLARIDQPLTGTKKISSNGSVGYASASKGGSTADRKLGFGIEEMQTAELG